MSYLKIDCSTLSRGEYNLDDVWSHFACVLPPPPPSLSLVFLSLPHFSLAIPSTAECRCRALPLCASTQHFKIKLKMKYWHYIKPMCVCVCVRVWVFVLGVRAFVIETNLHDSTLLSFHKNSNLIRVYQAFQYRIWLALNWRFIDFPFSICLYNDCILTNVATRIACETNRITIFK